MKFSLAAIGLSCLIATCAAQAVELPRIFADGMVLQRGRAIPVWGQAKPGARVAVEFAGRSATTTANARGAWRVELPAQPAGGPHVMRIDDGSTPRVFDDVLVGDVWLASGQSNMEWPLVQAADAEAEIARATDPMIRHFKVPKSWSDQPETQLAGGEWVASSPQAAGNFSAVAHLFARELRKRDKGVPVGIIDSTWGGSRIEAWLDAQALGLDAKQMAAHGRELREADARALAQTRRNLARWSLPADDAGWQAADVDESQWAPIKVPVLWESDGFNGVDGVAWYRGMFTLTAAEAKAGIVLGVGRIDDSDVTWVNGVQVGETHMQYNLPRRYDVPAQALRAGVNHVAVRVSDFGGGGGIHGNADEVFVQPRGGAARPLDDAWKFRVASATTVALVDDKNQHPTLLYNHMIHPLQPYALRGVIWYQGEANAGTVPDATRYREQFQALIRQWRMQWNAPQLPFMWVQLANFVSGADRVDALGNVESPWSVLRESQSAALSLPATAQAVTIDIGDSSDIHPLNKQDVAWRLALGARHVFGETGVHSGPTYKAMAVEGNRAVLTFDLYGSALAVRDGDVVHGFEIAGADGRFHPAQARIVGDTVVVQAVSKPAAVRYAWRDDPKQANLVNREGLPASPFRSQVKK